MQKYNKCSIQMSTTPVYLAKVFFYFLVLILKLYLQTAIITLCCVCVVYVRDYVCHLRVL